MGTRWRGLLALQNEPTADGRRFKTLSTRTLPLGTKWQRVDAEGHDDSVVVADFRTANLGTTKQAVEAGWISPEKAAESKLDPDAVGLWGSGEMFDDVDPEVMPRLAEDVAEAMTLLERGVISPSIDAIAVGAVMLVEPGQDEPPSQERMDELFAEYESTGVEPELEVLFTEGLVAAATLVVTPAFSEVRPFELLAPGDGEGDCPPGQHMMDGKCMPDSEMPAEATTERVLALTAAAPPRPPADVFADPCFTEYTPISVIERPDGLLQIAGHVGAWETCHLGIRDACVAPPPTAAAYVPFHRHVVELDSGELIGVGRITTAFGKLGTGCRGHAECRGKDDHACTRMSMAQAIAHHDRQTPLAWVRAGEDDIGIYVVGVADGDLSAEGRKLLEGDRGFSGDWREHGPGLEMVELLALTKGVPAFPPPRSYMRNGRQSSLVAAFRPPVDASAKPSVDSEWRRMARSVADLVVADLRAAGLAPTTADLDRIEAAAVTAAADEPTGAVVALLPAHADAARLAVDGGLPAEALHLSVAYLGDAAQYDQDIRNLIVETVWDLAEQAQPIEGDASSVSMFEPDSGDTAIVVGVGGQPVTDLRTAVVAALAGVVELPEQEQQGIALAYSDDVTVAEELAESKTGAIRFDRLRVMFGADVFDVHLGPAPEPDPAEQAAALAAEVDAAFAAVDAHQRAREAEALLKELEGAHV